jgi:hypothetical protein
MKKTLMLIMLSIIAAIGYSANFKLMAVESPKTVVKTIDVDLVGGSYTLISTPYDNTAVKPLIDAGCVVYIHPEQGWLQATTTTVVDGCTGLYVYSPSNQTVTLSGDEMTTSTIDYVDSSLYGPPTAGCYAKSGYTYEKFNSSNYMWEAVTTGSELEVGVGYWITKDNTPIPTTYTW